jgi:hypothetical protein
MSTVHIGLHQLKEPSVSPAISRLRPGLYFRFALPFRLVEEMTRNLISLVSVLSTPTRGLGAVLAAHAGSYSHVRFVRRGDLRRQLHVDSSRPLRANSGRRRTGRRTGQVDPKCAFKIGPMDERYAAECGRLRNKTVRQERSSDALRANRAKAHFYSARVTGGGVQAVDSA